ncbi:MATE family efflux transporter [Tropicimonas sp. TH_r6]|uniref:MATE family efflux transporter n=1 Tax=Tropicimonas sp. TH_r6 TaxID=3082085 RepID=UPI002955B9B3|nr:MATE family efflux transporter [Tropicimonas sp. TH_r6]MDV7141225.1 MATE family efflux transporter [Tropicimonas sp. TH_r6]
MSPQAPRSTAAVFNLAWPLTLKAMMLHGIVVIDAWLVSALGESGLAAMGLGGSFAALLLGVIIAFSNATQIRVAQAFGSGRDVALKTALLAGLFINLIAAVIGMVVIGAIAGPVIDLFAHTDWIAEQARLYLFAFLFVIVFEAVGQGFGSQFNGCGKTIMPFLSYLLAIPINVAVSYCLIHGLYGLPELGVMGAAVGSAVASLIRMGFLGINLWRLNGFYLGTEGWLHGSFAASLRRHFVFALPIAGTFMSNAFSNYVCTLLFARMSVNQFAAMTLIQPWVHVAGTFGIGWAMATGINVAQLLGQDQKGPELDIFLRRAWRGALIAAAIVACFYLVICLNAEHFYGTLEPETTAALLSFLPILLFLPFPKGSNAMCGHTLRAGGDTVYVMNIFLASQWLFRVPMTALFILWLGLPVTWVFALFLGEELVKFPLFHQRFLKGAWKRGLQEM